MEEGKKNSLSPSKKGQRPPLNRDALPSPYKGGNAVYHAGKERGRVCYGHQAKVVKKHEAPKRGGKFRLEKREKRGTAFFPCRCKGTGA